MADHGHDHGHHDDSPRLYGLVAEFNTPDDLLHATEHAYKAGYREMDAYSPFPIHGLAEAMGVTKSAVAPIVFCMGLCGAATAFLLQTIAMVFHYPYDIGGKPFFSWPSWMPVTFELTVLFGAFGAFFGMFLLNGLPRHHHPIFNAKNFERATSDGFFLCIEADDKQFDNAATRSFLEEQHPVQVSEVNY
jgi:hypothetical protein